MKLLEYAGDRIKCRSCIVSDKPDMMVEGLCRYCQKGILLFIPGDRIEFWDPKNQCYGKGILESISAKSMTCSLYVNGYALQIINWTQIRR